MGIYTKTGDKGTTSLFDGSRVKKNSIRVNTYGTFDELNAHLSVCEKLAVDEKIKSILNELQYKLFYLSAEIATQDFERLKAKSIVINDVDIKSLEELIDVYSNELPKVDSFVLPGRSLQGAELHVARTVCRRAERLLYKLSETEKIREELLIFTNRLSDCLYMFARVEDFRMQMEKTITEIVKKYNEAVGSSSSNVPYRCGLCFEKTQKILEACIKKAKEINVPMTISIVDAEANQVAFYRMPDCLLVSMVLAYKKAYTAVAMKTATHELQSVTQPGESLYNLEAICDGKIVTFGGGFVLYDKSGNIVGGIGISGGTVDEDIKVAMAGMKIQEEGE